MTSPDFEVVQDFEIVPPLLDKPACPVGREGKEGRSE